MGAGCMQYALPHVWVALNGVDGSGMGETARRICRLFTLRHSAPSRPYAMCALAACAKHGGEAFETCLKLLEEGVDFEVFHGDGDGEVHFDGDFGVNGDFGFNGDIYDEVDGDVGLDGDFVADGDVNVQGDGDVGADGNVNGDALVDDGNGDKDLDVVVNADGFADGNGDVFFKEDGGGDGDGLADGNAEGVFEGDVHVDGEGFVNADGDFEVAHGVVAQAGGDFGNFGPGDAAGGEETDDEHDVE